jgi:transposase InsO family protein
VLAQKAFHDVRTLCRCLDVSPSGFYAWCARPKSKRAVEDATLMPQIETIFAANRSRYGSPRITRELRSKGVRVGRHRVRRLMKGAYLRAARPRRWVRTTDSRHNQPIAANLLDRKFTVAAPNRVWVGDITYLPTREGWLYLAVLIDLFSRAVVGWSMSERIDQKLTMDALASAITKRNPPPGLVVHSDRGTQYAAAAYRQQLDRYKLVASMSRKGDCWDNAVAESFFATLKTELLRDQIFINRETARAHVFEYIEAYYNGRRLHSTLDYVSPMQYERTTSAA